MRRWLLRSRRRVMIVTLSVLVLLDVGRSAYARVGYAQPTQAWQPDPAVYADLAWPPGADLPSTAPVGQRVYGQRCAVCHGPDGRGNGPAAPSLIPRPRDFTAGQFKYATNDADLARIVADGLPASAMPYFRDLLSETEIVEVVRYVRAFGSASAPPTVPATLPIVTPRGAADSASVERGRLLYASQGCGGCHGGDGRAQTTLQDAKGYPVLARDLTAPWTFRGGSQPEQIWLRLTNGLAPAPMPSFADKTTPEQRWDLVNYVLSLARTPAWESGGTFDGPGRAADPLKRGEYLVHAEMCGLCHTQIDRTGIYRANDAYLAGGMRVEAYPQGVFVSRNLTGDAETGLGAWSESQIADAVRNGRAPDRTLNIWGMPWMFLHGLSEEDALAVAKYLKSLPPVHNQVPAVLHFGVLETVASKLSRPLPAANPDVLRYADGNFAQVAPGLSRDLPQTALIIGQWLVIVAGGVAFVVAAPAGLRVPRGVRGWAGLSGVLVVLVLGVLMGAALYDLPALSIIPSAQIADAVTAGIPRPDADPSAPPELTAAISRGRYLYTVASCAYCHGNDGGGGAKISWIPFGTLWARNVSSDRTTGIGGWTDSEIERAIRSGVTPDGRTLHWQGMIWDHASNWDEEDLRAIVAYLRKLPAVVRQIPAATPPGPNDCAVYTFWVATNRTPGCS